MTISRYVIVDKDDETISDHEYDTIDEAREDTPADEPWAIVEREFEYTDSSLVETSTGDTVWPPEAKEEQRD